jgi:SNF2 family DNA or RNA helicase
MVSCENRPRMVPTQPQGGILAHAMGLGKTISMLSLILCQPPTQTLVVCPKSLLIQWVGEATKLGFHHIHVYHGTTRTPCLPAQNASDHVLVLTTFEIVRIELKPMSYLHSTQWGRVVLDEAHRICEQASKTSRAIQMLKSRNRWCMSGTPFKNGTSDLMALSKFLMIGPYCNGNWWRLFGHSAPKLREWRDLHLHLRAKSVLKDLPPLELNNIRVQLSESEREVYTSLDRASWKIRAGECMDSPPSSPNDQHELIKILRQRQATNHPLLITSSGVAIHAMDPPSPDGCVGCGRVCVKMCEKGCHGLCSGCGDEPLCVGCIYGSLGGKGGWVHSAKTKALWSYLVTKACILTSPTKVVLFSQWTSCLDLVGHMLKKFGVGVGCYDGRVNSTEDREGVISRFKQDPTCKVLLTSLGAGGEGVNLTFATHVILMEPYWNMAAEQQAIDRLHRIGQKSTTHVARFVVEDTVEEWVQSIQTKKTDELNRVLFDVSSSKAPSSPRRSRNEIKNLFEDHGSMQSLGVFMKDTLPCKRIKVC